MIRYIHKIKKGLRQRNKVKKMKVLKNTDQRNFKIDTTYYAGYELYTLLENGIIDRPFKNIEKENGILDSDLSNIYFCVYTSDCTEVKVKYNKDAGQYETVAITNRGHELKVII